ncbi:G-protein coupled receptor 183-like [Hyaena hyaena]|uniref:G-protein coupled receptor 183-like n=1 Tax=Hyaena hyaena TaxID=95912 RepID=UPI0019233C29|nr:G-protein coupled receptor 183-like [Hyaena hyaena]
MTSSMTNPSSAPYNASSCLPHFPPRAVSAALSRFYTALLVFSALGNILALCLACQKVKTINSTGVYLVRLAVSDLLITLALPGRVAYYALHFSWPFGEGLCRLTAFILYVNTYGGVYLMTCVSVDRYVAVVRAHQRPQLRSAGRARLVCVALWALALLQTRAFRLSLQLTMPLMNMNLGTDPIIYFLASTRCRKWLLGLLKLRVSASSSSSPQGKASSETRSINQTGGSVPLAEDEV